MRSFRVTKYDEGTQSYNGYPHTMMEQIHSTQKETSKMPQLVLVTGASGFLGSHIVDQLLNTGFRVRASVRGARMDEIREAYEQYGEAFEVVEISDVTVDQFPHALVDVDAIIHTAAPLPQPNLQAEALINGAVEGTLNVVRQAHAAGVPRIIVTSSFATVLNGSNSFTDKDWHPAVKGQELKGTQFDAYIVAKTIAEKELWAFGEANPELDITTINPTFLWGPFAPKFRQTEPNYQALSSNLHIYRLLKLSSTFPRLASYADVRDIAKVHILALSSPLSSTSSIGRKRIIICSPHPSAFKDVVKLIRDNRPELEERINKETPPSFPYDVLPINFARVEEVLGFKKGDFRSLQETVLDAVDSILALEKQWISQGHKIDIPDL